MKARHSSCLRATVVDHCGIAADGVLSMGILDFRRIDIRAQWLQTENETNVARIRTTTRTGRPRIRNAQASKSAK